MSETGNTPPSGAGATIEHAPPAAGAPAADSEFVQQRLAAVAALPPEQRSADEAAFLRGHELLAAAQASLAALEGAGEPSMEDRCMHTGVAALALLGGLEQLAGLGAPLQALLDLNSDALVALGRHADVLRAAARAGAVPPRMVLPHCDLAHVLAQYRAESVLACGGAPPPPSLGPANFPNPAAELRHLHTALFNEIYGTSTEIGILLLSMTEAAPEGGLPGLDQLRRLWALLAVEWAHRLAAGVGRPAWMADQPGPTPDEARQLMHEALAAMRQLAPSHPLLGRMEAHEQADAGQSLEGSLRRGLELAAAAGGPHGASLLEAEYCYGLIQTCAPTADTPPWGRVSLADAAQLLQRGDAAWARCKALLPPTYRVAVKHLRGLPSVAWRRAAVERHQQAGATEWREDLLAAEPAPHVDASQKFGMLRGHRAACACCGSRVAELRGCSGCKLPDAKYCSKECQARHWPQHKRECRAARAARAAAVQPGQAVPPAGEGAGAS